MAVPRPPLKACAVLLLLAMTGYSAALIHYNRHRFPDASLGLTAEFVESERALRIDRVQPDGPAARAGLAAGDRIIALNGQPLPSINPYWDAVFRGARGDTVRLTVRRTGGSEVRDVAMQLGHYQLPPEIDRGPLTSTQLVALNILSLYPIPFLVVAGVVLLQRPHDRHAWLLAVLFGSFIAGVDLPNLLPVVHPALRKPLFTYWALLAAVPPGALYCFFASFPEPTALDRRAPWLKVVLLGVPLAVGTAVAIAVLFSPGQPGFLSSEVLTPARQDILGAVAGVYTLVGYGLGLASLVWNAFRARPETRRRTRVMLWGTAAALLPVIVLGSYTETRGINFIDLPFWVWVGAVMALFFLPLSMAYAIVKHRVMEIPVLLKRSARYVVVQRAIVIVAAVVGLALTFLFATVLSRLLPEGPAATMSAGPASGVAGAIFGVLVAMATRRVVRRVTDRLDRAFFREAYDARKLLQDVARRTRTAADRRELATLLERSLTDALHPASLVVLVRTPAGRLEPVDAKEGTRSFSLDAAAVERDTPGDGGAAAVRPAELPDAVRPLAAIEPELLAPMQGHEAQLEGLLVLGPRLSDEPYGGEDRELIASVASQAGTALQNFRLAGAMAERLEAERRDARELAIAREVQAKLLPQRAPALASLDYAGTCIQARQVGGDYYDFLYLGPGRLGFVLADISGKGISAALLMASLQASLRSHYAQSPDDLASVLPAINQTFFESTAGNRYATLFVGTYDESTSRLRYANCGHPPPVLIGRDGEIRRLAPTGPVIGLFEEWRGTTGEVCLVGNDTLVMFTDGVVEAFNARDEEFGEERLVDVLRGQSGRPASALVDALVDAVQRHSGPAQSDDLTLVVAKGRVLSPMTGHLP